MILTSLLLLSPALSPLAPPQEAERKVVIRRQGVESGKAKPHPEHARQAHEHARHETELQAELIELQVMEEVLAEMESLEAVLLELEGEKLALELAALEHELHEREIHLERLHLEEELHHALQEPGEGHETAVIVITFGNGDTQILEWEGHRDEIHEEVISYLGDRHDGMLEENELVEYLLLAETAEECTEAAEACCGDCEEACGSCEAEEVAWVEMECEEETACEDSWEEDVLFEAVSGMAQPGGNVFFLGEEGGMAFGCECDACPLGSGLDAGFGAAGIAVPGQVYSTDGMGMGLPGQVRVRTLVQPEMEYAWTTEAAPKAEYRQRIVLGAAEAPQPEREAIRFEFRDAQDAPAGRLVPPAPPVPPTPSVAVRRAPAGGELERRVDELDMRLDRIEAMLGELLERR
jgi:hypothetical protein